MIATSIGGARASEVPPGFVETIVLDIDAISDLDWSPDGTMWLSSPRATLFSYDGETLRWVVGLNGGQDGINGFAIDPDFETNQHIWIYYVTGEPSRNRLARFTYNGTTLIDETVIIDLPLLVTNVHNGGCVEFASDGTLFLTTGDEGEGSLFSQDPFDLRGKVLHLNRDGTPAADNPYLDGVEGNPFVWARGLRNPHRCGLDAADNVFIADVGSNLYEEINVGFAGANFGWAMTEGPSPPGVPGVTYPLHSYSNVGGAAVIAGAFSGPDDFPADEYLGDFFFADFVKGEIYRMQFHDHGHVDSISVWATGVPSPVALRFGPDGALYYVSVIGDKIGRIEFVGGTNRQPVAVATGTPLAGEAPLDVQFDGSESFDPDGGELTYSWNLGDGASASVAQPGHQFAAGVYNTVLTVTDEDDGVGVATPLRVVSGNAAPVATITGPSAQLTYDAGDTIQFSGSVVDPEDGTLNCADLTWTVNFHHDVHFHPFLGPEQGSCSGSFVTATAGEFSPNTWYRITLQAQDSGDPIGEGGAVTGSTVVDIHPNLSQFTLASAPRDDLVLALDTQPVDSPHTVTGVVGFTRLLGVASPQLADDGHTWRFLNWSDGGAEVHTISTPAAPMTYTATFGCDVVALVTDLQVEADGGELRFGWTGVTDPCLAEGEVRYHIYAAETPIPSSEPGQFPDDPAFALVGTSFDTQFSYVPAPADRYFLVVGRGTDNRGGASGHYPGPTALAE